MKTRFVKKLAKVTRNANLLANAALYLRVTSTTLWSQVPTVDNVTTFSEV